MVGLQPYAFVLNFISVSGSFIVRMRASKKQRIHFSVFDHLHGQTWIFICMQSGVRLVCH